MGALLPVTWQAASHDAPAAQFTEDSGAQSETSRTWRLEWPLQRPVQSPSEGLAPGAQPMNRSIAIAVALAASLAAAAHAEDSGRWQTIHREQGVLVSTRDEPGRDLPSFRGQANVNAPV